MLIDNKAVDETLFVLSTPDAEKIDVTVGKPDNDTEAIDGDWTDESVLFKVKDWRGVGDVDEDTEGRNVAPEDAEE